MYFYIVYCNLSEEIQLTSWFPLLRSVVECEEFTSLQEFLNKEASVKRIYPRPEHVFSALQLTPPGKVKAVIIGQDPYFREGQAHGLSFSVRPGIKIPPSLRNIFKALCTQFPGVMSPACGDLSSWASEGVLLLNAALTVEDGKPGIHQKHWQFFTDEVIRSVSSSYSNIAFLLWGNFAQQKKGCISDNDHLILECPHPSPMAMSTGFKFALQCDHFKRTNDFLSSKGITPIEWQLL